MRPVTRYYVAVRYLEERQEYIVINAYPEVGDLPKVVCVRATRRLAQEEADALNTADRRATEAQHE